MEKRQERKGRGGRKGRKVIKGQEEDIKKKIKLYTTADQI